MIHPSEDELETYLIGPAPREANTEAQIAAIEEHLLICGPCLDWIQHQERAIGLMRACLRRPAVKPERKVRQNAMANQGWLFQFPAR